jgi:uncharacterized protein (DUF488 family)
MSTPKIYTIGHSNHEIETFINLLKTAKIDMIVDVRSAPFSKMYPHFNRDTLESVLKDNKIGYLFLGDLIGGRSRNRSDYENGQVVYSRLASKDDYQATIKRVLDGSAKFQIALMCSEKEPLDCHRTLLVSQSLSDRGVEVAHIHADGKIESQSDVLNRLLRNYNLDAPDLFGVETDRLQEALLKQEKKIAYCDEQMSEG